MTEQRIQVTDYGPFLVSGKIPLVRKLQVSSDPILDDNRPLSTPTTESITRDAASAKTTD